MHLDCGFEANEPFRNYLITSLLLHPLPPTSRTALPFQVCWFSYCWTLDNHCWTLDFGEWGNLFALILRRFPFILHKKVLLCASTPINLSLLKPFLGQKIFSSLVTKYLIQKENPWVFWMQIEMVISRRLIHDRQNNQDGSSKQLRYFEKMNEKRISHFNWSISR